MFTRLWVAIIMFWTTGSGVFAATEQELTESQKLKIKIMAQEFYLNQAQAENLKDPFLEANLLSRPGGLNSKTLHCDPDDENGPSCVSTLCQFTHCSGSTGREIAEACRGASGSCVKKLCEFTHCSGSTGREIAQSCRRSSGLCVAELCRYTHCSGSTGREIAEACEGSDGSCVQELCKTTHCSGSTGREIARSCAGHQ